MLKFNSVWCAFVLKMESTFQQEQRTSQIIRFTLSFLWNNSFVESNCQYPHVNNVIYCHSITFYHECLSLHCVVPENIHTSHKEGILSKIPQPLWKFQLGLIYFSKCFGFREPLMPPQFQISFVGRVWIFSGLHIGYTKYCRHRFILLQVVSSLKQCSC